MTFNFVLSSYKDNRSQLAHNMMLCFFLNRTLLPDLASWAQKKWLWVMSSKSSYNSGQGRTVTDDWLQEVLALNIAEYTAWDSSCSTPKPKAWFWSSMQRFHHISHIVVSEWWPFLHIGFCPISWIWEQEKPLLKSHHY